jgi:hypothetical protein
MAPACRDMIMANRGKPFKTIVEAGHPLFIEQREKIGFFVTQKMTASP